MGNNRNGDYMENINSCVEYIKNEFKNCADFNCRKFNYPNEKCGYLINIGSYTDRAYISESVIKPLLMMKKVPSGLDEIFANVTCSELSLLPGKEDAITKLLSGFAVILTEISAGYIILGAMVKMTASRSVQEPESEVVIKGPREGFIESSEDNLALLRKRLKSTNFKAVRTTCGDYTDTTIYICYINGVASDDTVDRVKKQISSINMPAIIDSGYIEHYLQKKSPSLFTNVGSSEKPDVVAAKLLEGRVAIICDGSPVVLTVPYLFIESLQSAEDYLKTPYYSTFVRLLRFISAIISLYLPSVYLSVVEHHTSALPYKLYKTIIKLRQDVPFEVFGELMVILFIFELIREVGIRMPRAVGSAVGIVAGLILGDAAISAGLASAPVIMAASLTAVCTFIVPTFMNSFVLIRFINIILAQIFGFTGIILSACFILSCMARKESFGVPYLMPISPLKPGGIFDTIISIPKKALKHTTNSIYKHGE